MTIASQLRLENYGATLNGNGASGVAGADDIALATAIADAQRGAGPCEIGWNGSLTLSVSPPPLYRVHLVGDDILGSTVRKNYPGGILFNFGGPPGYGGGGLHNLGIPSNPMTRNSYIIYYSASNSSQAPDALILENLYLSSGIAANAPFRNIHLDGSLRTSPEGIRKPVIRNVTAFGATGGNVYMAGICGMTVENLATYDVPGTDADVYMRGGSGFQSAENSFENCQVSTCLHLGDLIDCRFEGTFNSISWENATASSITVQPRNFSGMTQMGTLPANCRVQ